MQADTEDGVTPESAVARLMAYYQRQRDDALDRLDEARGRYPIVGLLYDIVSSDRQAGGALLAGALAFRLFLWLLPAGLVIVGGLGFLAPSEAEASSQDVGLGTATASTFAAASEQAHQGRWVLLIIGLVTLYWSSGTLARTLWLATSLAWRLPVARFRGRARAAGVLLAALVPALLLAVAANWLRDLSYSVGVVVTLLMVVVYALVGWAVLSVLPHPRDISPFDLLPGAVLIGLGTQGLHLFTAFYLGDKLTHSSALYGGLGGAATILLWAYILARVLVAASTINRVWVDLRLQQPAARLTSGPHPTWTWRNVPAMVGSGWRDAITQVKDSMMRPEVLTPDIDLILADDDPVNLTAWTFDDPWHADEAAEILSALAHDHQVRVSDWAVVRWPLGSRNPDTTPSDPNAPPGELGPAFWGLVFGLTFFAPLLDRSTQAAGLLGGSMGGVGMDERFAADVRERVMVGTSALFVLCDDSSVSRLHAALSTLPHGLVRTGLSAEQDAALHTAFAP